MRVNPTPLRRAKGPSLPLQDSYCLPFLSAVWPGVCHVRWSLRLWDPRCSRGSPRRRFGRGPRHAPLRRNRFGARLLRRRPSWPEGTAATWALDAQLLLQRTARQACFFGQRLVLLPVPLYRYCRLVCLPWCDTTATRALLPVSVCGTTARLLARGASTTWAFLSTALLLCSTTARLSVCAAGPPLRCFLRPCRPPFIIIPAGPTGLLAITLPPYTVGHARGSRAQLMHVRACMLEFGMSVSCVWVCCCDAPCCHACRRCEQQCFTAQHATMSKNANLSETLWCCESCYLDSCLTNIPMSFLIGPLPWCLTMTRTGESESESEAIASVESKPRPPSALAGWRLA